MFTRAMLMLFAFTVALLCISAGADASHATAGPPARLDLAACGGAHACGADADVASFLLQASADMLKSPTRSAPIDAGSPSRAFDDSFEPPAPILLEKPFELHVPKAGTSLANILVHYVCGDAIPANVTVQHEDAIFDVFGEQCPRSKFGRFANAAVLPIPPSTPLDTVVTFLREPRSRALSGYEYNFVQCHSMQVKYKCGHWHQDKPCPGDVLVKGNWVRNASVIDPMEYAKCTEQALANQLTGDHSDVAGAVRRVDELGFVGITEEWNMSVCLFHAKFGGPFLTTDVYNSRPGVEKRVGDDPVAHALITQAEDRLKSWDAMPEMRVYEAGLARFWREVDRYKIDRKSCQKKIDDAIRKDPSVSPPLQTHPITFRADAEGVDPTQLQD